ncbi:CCAAT/enhancer-binding protein gamma [Hippocampus zosterae]|uniref:CCAAT/enhancer-binding protein gamma n=1 Tax=Hippocampus zosterae TaxID=109293 RepID=UPI00223E15B1|nr:CCAAT/enhancer-binding protein gamma [Hippocampus zosterae]
MLETKTARARGDFGGNSSGNFSPDLVICHRFFTLVSPRTRFSRRSAVRQMSRPSQPKVASSDPNGAGVIRSHSRAAQPSSPGGKMKKTPADKDSDEYRQRRERNNLAVKKSRQRSKQKAMDTQQRVNQLKEENERLEAKIKLLSKELSVLKDLFLEHAHNLADNVQPPSGNPDASPAPNNQ